MPTYELPPLAYDHGALEPHLSGRIVELHHDRHHAAYVQGANTALEQLDEARAGGGAGVAALQCTLAFHVSGHVLHSILWTNLSPDGGGEPTGDLAEVIGRDFGSFDGFRHELEAAASTIQGSGWAVAAWEPTAGRLVVEQVHDHQAAHAQGSTPLLVVDVWEHAYYLQYENRRGDYLDAIWNVVDWGDVAARLDAARGSR